VGGCSGAGSEQGKEEGGCARRRRDVAAQRASLAVEKERVMWACAKKRETVCQVVRSAALTVEMLRQTERDRPDILIQAFS
jgi:hypothetical protein